MQCVPNCFTRRLLSSTQTKLRNKKSNTNSGIKRITGETCSPSSLIRQLTNIGDSASVIGRPTAVTCLIVEWLGQLIWPAGWRVARSRASSALFRFTATHWFIPDKHRIYRRMHYSIRRAIRNRRPKRSDQQTRVLA